MTQGFPLASTPISACRLFNKKKQNRHGLGDALTGNIGKYLSMSSFNFHVKSVTELGTDSCESTLLVAGEDHQRLV